MAFSGYNRTIEFKYILIVIGYDIAAGEFVCQRSPQFLDDLPLLPFQSDTYPFDEPPVTDTLISDDWRFPLQEYLMMPAGSILPANQQLSSGNAGEYLLTENADPLLTEAGEHILTEMLTESLPGIFWFVPQEDLYLKRVEIPHIEISEIEAHAICQDALLYYSFKEDIPGWTEVDVSLLGEACTISSSNAVKQSEQAEVELSHAQSLLTDILS